MATTFLTGEWRKLVMINYIIDKHILEKYLPKGTEIELFEGKCYISLIGFMFMNTKLKGIPIPFHRNFEEINLRFYVTREENGIKKRGVVFIKEIVPKPAITIIANTLYNEKYETLPMKYQWIEQENSLEIIYQTKRKNWQSFSIQTSKEAFDIAVGSKAEFITEHYWGYNKFNNLKTIEYNVKHPRWKVYETLHYETHFDFNEMYGEEFAFLNTLKADAVFLAEGSEVEIMGLNKLVFKTEQVINL